MDRSFLSQPSVIEASRQFVCVRLATYENKAEAEFLKTIFIGRSGELENTTFAILSPDGKRQLVRSGRSPDFAFRGPLDFAAESMASSMNRIAAQYEAQDVTGKELGLPVLADFRLALNVAACDNLPLIVSFADESQQVRRIEDTLTPLAWSDEFIGQFLYASATKQDDLKQIKGLKLKSGLAVIQPNRFGVEGELIAQLDADASAEDIADALNLAIVLHQRFGKETRDQTTSARRLGINWKSKIPVTDPGVPPGGGRPPGGR